jgi:hypothetical protein
VIRQDLPCGSRSRFDFRKFWHTRFP